MDTKQLKLGAEESYQVQDVLTDAKYVWHGSRNFVRLDPTVLPAHVFSGACDWLRPNKESTVKVKEKYALYERQAPVLERIAKKYPEGSAEYAALKQAAFALCFALTQKYEEFTKYVTEMNRPMTKEDEKRLKELGLN